MRVMIFSGLTAALLSGCGHQAAPPPPPTLSALTVTQAHARSFILRYMWRNTTHHSEYLTVSDMSLQAVSPQGSGGLAAEQFAVTPSRMWYQTGTIGLNHAFPVAVKPGQTLTVFAQVPRIPMAPLTQAQWTVNLGALQTTQSLAHDTLAAISQPALQQALERAQTAIDQYTQASANAKQYAPTNTVKALAASQPLAGQRAQEIDLRAWTPAEGARPVLPTQPQKLGLPRWTAYPANNTVYWGITAQKTVFATWTPPQIPATDSTVKPNTPGTGNGAWTIGNTTVFTVQHPNHGVALYTIW
jgi:hypothetical protein